MQVKPYEQLSLLYDTLYNKLYERNIKLLEDVFGSWITDGENKQILDIGCGTGMFLIHMVKNGWQGTGIDISEDMINMARQNAATYGVSCDFLVQDMNNINCDGKFDLITCNFDAINYLTEDKKIVMLFKSVYKLLKNNGYFVFDIITPYQCKTFSKEFGKQINNILFKIKPSYNENDSIKKTMIEFEYDNKKFTEIHFQKCYDVAFIKNIISNFGYKVKVILDIESRETTNVNEKTTRAFFVIQKQG